MNDILPPKPPAHLEKKEEPKQEPAPAQALDLKREEPKQGFLKKFFKTTPKQEEMALTDLSLDDAPPMQESKSIKQFESLEKDSKPQTNLSESDLKNIREALGISKPEESIQKKWEDELEVKAKKPEETPGKKTDIDWHEELEELPPAKKETPMAEEIHPPIQEHIDNATEKLEKTKQKLLKGATKQIADAKPVQAAYAKHSEKVKQQLDKALKSHDKKLVAAMAKERRKLEIEGLKASKAILSLKKKQTELEKKEANLTQRETETKRITSNLEKLQAQAEALKNSISQQKTAEKEYKAKAKSAKAELDNLYKDHQQKLKAVTEAYSRTKNQMEKVISNLGDLKLKADELFIKTEDASRELARKQEKIQRLIKEENRIYEFLRKHSESSPKKTKSIIEDEQILPDMPQNTPKRETPEQTIEEDILDCKDLIREGQLEDAKMLYNYIRQDFLSANLSDSKKASIKHELKELYDEIALKILHG